MGFLFLLVVIGYFLLGALILWAVKSLTGSQKAVWGAAVLLLIGPFWRPLFCSLFFTFTVREPLQEIHQTVESPESVYWQDDVWPGFDAYGRRWMVEQYLDGDHLKVLSLNGDDGKIYLYRAEKEMFIETEKMKEQMDRLDPAAKDYPKLRTAYMRLKSTAIDKIVNNVEMINSISQLPPMRYRVHFVLQDNWWRERGIYHADKAIIIEAKTQKVIAYSRRYMPFANWLMKFSGNQPKYFHGPGDQQAYGLDDKVLFAYASVNSSYESKRNNLRK